MDYNNTFQKRGNLYKYATEVYPHVLDNEFQTAVNMCDICEGQVILNIPAACVPLKRYFPENIQDKICYIEYETNSAFATLMNIPCCQFTSVPLIDNTVDTIITLASLHHSNIEERTNFYKECNRLLIQRPGSKLIIGDILKGSKQDDWLNIFVNKYNSSGHTGIFWNDSDINLLESCGFNCRTAIKTYMWTFVDENAMLDFTKNLFGLDMASDIEILNGLNQYLHPIYTKNCIYIEWSLIYFISTISQTLVHDI